MADEELPAIRRARLGTLTIYEISEVELEVIEKKRWKEGAPSVWDRDPKSITENYDAFFHDPSKNLFYRRPGHIAAAGKLGLGVADLKQIDHRRISA